MITRNQGKKTPYTGATVSGGRGRGRARGLTPRRDPVGISPNDGPIGVPPRMEATDPVPSLPLNPTILIDNRPISPSDSCISIVRSETRPPVQVAQPTLETFIILVQEIRDFQISKGTQITSFKEQQFK